MYYQEKKINGVWMFKTTQNGAWKMLKSDLPTVIGNIILKN